MAGDHSTAPTADPVTGVSRRVSAQSATEDGFSGQSGASGRRRRRDSSIRHVAAALSPCLSVTTGRKSPGALAIWSPRSGKICPCGRWMRPTGRGFRAGIGWLSSEASDCRAWRCSSWWLVRSGWIPGNCWMRCSSGCNTGEARRRCSRGHRRGGCPRRIWSTSDSWRRPGISPR